VSRCSARDHADQIKLWGTLWRDWITSVDHKKIGIMYIDAGPGHAAARLCRCDHDARCSRRWPSAGPRAISTPHHYDQIFTAHGVIMIFFVAMPLVTGLMNYRCAAADRRARRQPSRS
jgi:cytochrome o ubiquinol oxidase subunit 1